MQPNPVIIFDSICNLCNWSVRFIINHDSQHHFKLTSLRSDEGRRLIAAHNIPVESMDSLILVEDSGYQTKSNAAIRVLKQLSGWWSLLSILTIIPQPLRDWCYDLIARNRYKWFGEVNHCAVSLNIDQN